MSLAQKRHSRAFTVTAAERGERLDRFLAGRLPEISRSRIKALIKDGHTVRDGGTIVEPNTRVKPGEAYLVSVPPPEDPEPQPEDIPLDVVFEDEHLIVIDKKAGLVVHPAAGNWTGTLVNALIAHCGASLSGIGGVRRPGIVHRLDKDTSGLMVVAKTDAAHQGLSRQFADHGRTGALERGYLALVWGAPSRKGTIDAALGRKPAARQKRAVLRDGGKPAVTRYLRLETFAAQPGGEPVASLVGCTLETGRTHQIRVHLAHIGHPVVGDRVYGAGFSTKVQLLPEAARLAVETLGRQALHAHLLGFAHPATGETMRFESGLPADIMRVVNHLTKG